MISSSIPIVLGFLAVFWRIIECIIRCRNPSSYQAYEDVDEERERYNSMYYQQSYYDRNYSYQHEIQQETNGYAAVAPP